MFHNCIYNFQIIFINNKKEQKTFFKAIDKLKVYFIMTLNLITFYKENG